MATDLYDAILTAALGVVQSVAFDGIPESQIVARHLPKAAETIDTLPLIVFAPSEMPEEVEPLSPEETAAYEITYWADCVFIAASNHDFKSRRKAYLRWREQIRRCFQVPRLDGVLAVYEVVIKPWTPLDRNLLNQNYAYSGLSIGFKTVEQRTN